MAHAMRERPGVGKRDPAAYICVMDIPRLTDSAAARVAAIAAKQGRAAQLRLSVDGGGCAGFSYRFGMADAVDADDLVSAHGDVALVVDPVSLPFLEGAEVDFVSNLGGAAFQVRNPQAASGCGCGASFSV